jgi:N-methylhydantoinase A
VSAVGRLPAPNATSFELRGDGRPSRSRKIWLAGSWREVAVWDRDQLPLGGTVVGPAVIEEAYTTVLLLEGWNCRRDKGGHLIAQRA